MIVQTVNVHTFRQAFIDMGRKENFTYAGLEALFEHLEEMSEGSGMNIELDVIGLCCEYNEMSWDEVSEEYGENMDGDLDNDVDELLEILQDNTLVVYHNDERVLFEAF